MNDEEMKRLMVSARREVAPSPPEGFAARVMMAVRREPRALPMTLWEQLDAIFPRLAFAAAAVIAACLLADFCHSAMRPSDLSAGLDEISEQWLYAANGGAND
jgi:hypothetical protein